MRSGLTLSDLLIGEHEVVWTPWICSSLVSWRLLYLYRFSLPEQEVGLVALEDLPVL